MQTLNFKPKTTLFVNRFYNDGIKACIRKNNIGNINSFCKAYKIQWIKKTIEARDIFIINFLAKKVANNNLEWRINNALIETNVAGIIGRIREYIDDRIVVVIIQILLD